MTDEVHCWLGAIAEHDYCINVYHDAENNNKTDDEETDKEDDQDNEQNKLTNVEYNNSEDSQSDNYLLNERLICHNSNLEGRLNDDDDTDEEDDIDESEKELKSILKVREWPWIDEAFCKKDNSRCVRMTEYEEHALMNKLSNAITCFKNDNPNDEVPIKINMLYRKLRVRQLKRSRNLKIFNFDDLLDEYYHQKFPMNVTADSCDNSSVIDKQSVNKSSCSVSKVELDLQIILSKGSYPDLSHIISRYTNRYLKPFIWCDADIKPKWLKLMNEIKRSKITLDRSRDDNNKMTDDHHNHCSPICYSYIRSEYIPAINYLCSINFWPGIDVSESLQYPDFSCVALYKKLVVGFALMVPDVTATESYITFLFTRPGWRNCGIATFMLYHLIQTCMGKDITIHVAADNPSLFLYQKFGFKVERFVKKFYDKYLPITSHHTKHALFLRLSR